MHKEVGHGRCKMGLAAWQWVGPLWDICGLGEAESQGDEGRSHWVNSASGLAVQKSSTQA